MLKLYAKIKPNGKQNKVCGWLGDVVKIEIKAKPVDGMANKVLVDFLSKKTGIGKGFIKIVSGHTSKMKLLEFDAMIQIDELRRKLA